MNSTPPGQAMTGDQNTQAIDPSTLPVSRPQPQSTPDSKTSENSPLASISFALEQTNVAEHLSEEKLTKIGETALKGFKADKSSRKQWEDQIEEWTRLAGQVKESKSYPWPKASNIKYPLLSTAAMQFAARAYPSLVPSDGNVVKAQVLGFDHDGKKQERAMRVSRYMSFQLMHEMGGWEEDMDKMLIMLPIVGTIFKKTYFDKATGKNKSDLVFPQNLVVNYWARSLDTCERMSEIIEMSPRILKERQTAKIFLDIDLGDPQSGEFYRKDIPASDETTPYIIIEQHTYIDLNDSGHERPYIVTFHRDSGKVLRISPRFDHDGIKTDSKGEVIRVEAIQYYTKFGFVPNPDGGFYDIGFGMLLGPINESVNSLINQLIDAGTMNNLQAGFIGKGLRIKMGESPFKPGEWKAVNSTADDLKKQILPLPTKEPSAVLFQLMGSLITSGKELASVAEIFVGKMPGQNTPATTTMATIEQGMKVFTAVYKRLFRSLSEEFKKLYRLNEVYLNPNTYFQILETAMNPQDFSKTDYSVCPGADPTAVSQTEKLLKAQGLMELLPTGMLDPMAVIQRVLEAQEQPNWQQLIHQETQQTGQPAQQGPDPKMMELQMKGQAMEKQSQLRQQESEQKSTLAARDQQTKEAMAAQKQATDAEFEQQRILLAKDAQDHKLKAAMHGKAVQEVQKLVHNEQAHRQQMHHSEEKAKLAKSQSKNSSTGKTRK